MNEILVNILWSALFLTGIIGCIFIILMALVFIYNLVTEFIDDIFGGKDE